MVVNRAFVPDFVAQTGHLWLLVYAPRILFEILLGSARRIPYEILHSFEIPYACELVWANFQKKIN